MWVYDTVEQDYVSEGYTVNPYYDFNAYVSRTYRYIYVDWSNNQYGTYSEWHDVVIPAPVSATAPAATPHQGNVDNTIYTIYIDEVPYYLYRDFDSTNNRNVLGLQRGHRDIKECVLFFYARRNNRT